MPTAGATATASMRQAIERTPLASNQLDIRMLSGTNAGKSTSSGRNCAPMLAASTVPPNPMAPSVAKARRATTPRMTSRPGSSRNPLMSQAVRLEKQLYRTVKETCEHYELLRPNDRILVAMSGGKDSYTLFHLLTRLIPRLPFRVEIVAVHLDQVQPGYDGNGLRAFLEASGQPFEILREDTSTVVTD